MTKTKHSNSTPFKALWRGVRSLSFVPAHVERFYQKAIESEADALALDLEDAVPEPMKEQAREILLKSIRKKRPQKPTVVRINDASTPWHESDIHELGKAGVDGFILPKVYSAKDLHKFDLVLDKLEKDTPPIAGRFVILPLIETAAGVLHAAEIAAASERVTGLIFGHEDYLLDVQAEHAETTANLNVPRTMVVLAARAAGCVPIDTPYLDIRNLEGCRKHVEEGRELGFSGMLVLHPAQLEIANQGYSPSVKAIEHARQVVRINNEAKQGNRSIAFTDGQFVAPPIVKQAQALLQRAKDLHISTDTDAPPAGQEESK